MLAGFMLFIFTAFFFVIGQHNAAAVQQGRHGELIVVADIINQEVTNAYRVQDDYSRVFELPLTVNGDSYAITINGQSEIALTTANEEYLLFLPANVTALNASGGPTTNIIIGPNRISKTSGKITIRPA